jgi:hypothetical protein
MYVIAWEITYYNFFPDFIHQYNAHALAKMRAAGESETAIREATMKMADFAEVFPVGLIMTLVSAAILRRKPGQNAPASAVPAWGSLIPRERRSKSVPREDVLKTHGRQDLLALPKETIRIRRAMPEKNSARPWEIPRVVRLPLGQMRRPWP